MEKEFKSKLKGSVPKWDKMKNWNAIEAQLPKPKKKRRWLYFFLPSMSIMLLLFVVGWQLSLSDSGSQNDPKSAEAFNVQENSDKKIENSKISKAGNNTILTEINENNNSPKRLSQNNYPPTYNKDTKASDFLMVDNPRTELNYRTVNTKTNDSSSTQLSSSINGMKTAKEESITEQVIPQKEGIEEISLLAIPSLYPVISEGTTDLDEKINLTTPVKRKKANVTPQAYVSISMPFRQLPANESEIQPYLDSRENRETMAQSIETGILLSAYLTPAISLSSGVGLQKLTERFDWENVKTEIIPVFSDTAYFYIGQSNQRNYVADTVNAVFTETRRVKNFNTHTFINIPLLAGYEKNVGQFSVKASAGPILQFYRGFEGQIFDENENFITGGELRTQGVYKNKVGFSLQAGMEASRSFGRFGRLHAGVQYRHGLLSVTDASTAYKQTYNSVGFNLGWSFKLFR